MGIGIILHLTEEMGGYRRAEPHERHQQHHLQHFQRDSLVNSQPQHDKKQAEGITDAAGMHPVHDKSEPIDAQNGGAEPEKAHAYQSRGEIKAYPFQCHDIFSPPAPSEVFFRENCSNMLRLGLAGINVSASISTVIKLIMV